MFAEVNLATGALGTPVETAPEPREGFDVVEIVPSFTTGKSIWSPEMRGFIDPPTFRAALLALLVAKGTISQGEANGLPLE